MLRITDAEVATVVDISKLITHIGTCEYFDLLYNRLSARVYIDHKEEDFEVQVLKVGICTYIQLYSKKDRNVLEWILCDDDLLQILKEC